MSPAASWAVVGGTALAFWVLWGLLAALADTPLGRPAQGTDTAERQDHG